MAPRRRSKGKSGWPAHLYERNGYYSWRHPHTREEFGIGRDRKAAFIQATEANLYIQGLREKPRLIHKLTGSAERSVEKWNEKYQSLLDEQDYTPSTRKAYKSFGKRMVRMLGAHTPLQSVDALKVSDGLEAIAGEEGKPRLAQALRAWIRDSFREARVKGWYVGDNPVQDTRLKTAVNVKRARLSLEVFQRIYSATEITWLKHAMALALVSGQRRQDIGAAQFRDIRDGAWWLIQLSEKSEERHHIVIPLDLRLEAFGMSLGDVVSMCRKTGIASPYLVHHTVTNGKRKKGKRLNLDTISRTFADEVEALDIDWGDKEPPSFHEIRSLAERLYSAQGINTQLLLGHIDPKTTQTYHDLREPQWVHVEVPKA